MSANTEGKPRGSVGKTPILDPPPPPPHVRIHSDGIKLNGVGGSEHFRVPTLGYPWVQRDRATRLPRLRCATGINDRFQGLLGLGHPGPYCAASSNETDDAHRGTRNVCDEKKQGSNLITAVVKLLGTAYGNPGNPLWASLYRCPFVAVRGRWLEEIPMNRVVCIACMALPRESGSRTSWSHDQPLHFSWGAQYESPTQVCSKRCFKCLPIHGHDWDTIRHDARYVPKCHVWLGREANHEHHDPSRRAVRLRSDVNRSFWL